MRGTGNILAEMISDKMKSYVYEQPKGCPVLDEINWKEKRPAQMLGLNKDEFAFCRRMMWDSRDLGFYRRAKEEKLKIRLPADMAACKNIGYYAVFKLRDMKLPVMPTVRYLLRQRDRGKTATIDLGYLEDYWRMARRNGFDPEDKAVKWPGDLKAAHDRQAEIERFRMEAERKAREAKKEEELRGLFERRLEELAPFAWRKGKLLIRPAASYGEFVAEGSALKHCVAGYAESHAKGKTALFWIRRCNKPEEPYFTLELNEKTLEVRQNRGYRNCDRTKEVEAFEAEWLKQIQGLRSKKLKAKEVNAA
jgi:hypothetical protein